jgi:hypothetical protein
MDIGREVAIPYTISRDVATVDDLIGTGMRLPFGTGSGLFAWAYEAGILP